MSRDQKKLVMGSFAAALLIVPIIAHAATGVPQSSVTNVFKPSTEAITQFSDTQNTNNGRAINGKFAKDENGDGSQPGHELLVEGEEGRMVSPEYNIEDKRTSNEEYLRVNIIPVWYNPDINAVDFFTEDLKITNISAYGNYLVFSMGEEAKIAVYLVDGWGNDWQEQEPENSFVYLNNEIADDKTTKPLINSVVISDGAYNIMKANGLELKIDILTDTIKKSEATAERGWNLGT